MRPLGWMVGASLLGWLVLTMVAASVNPEAFFGMIGPLVSAGATWVIAARTYATAPARLTRVMAAGFAVKVLFFGGYVVVMLRALDLRPRVFAASFAGFFIALHAMEALFLRRLFLERARAGSGA